MLSSNNTCSGLNEEKARAKRLRQDEIKREIEAILFTARKILSFNEILAIFPGKDKKLIWKLIHELITEYKSTQTAFEVIKLSDERFELKIRDGIVNSIGVFSQKNQLKKSDVKILALIAHLQPTTRKEIRNYLGTSSTLYNNIKYLKKLDFISDLKGKIRLSQFFYDYFQLKRKDKDLVKSLLQKYNAQV